MTTRVSVLPKSNRFDRSKVYWTRSASTNFIDHISSVMKDNLADRGCHFISDDRCKYKSLCHRGSNYACALLVQFSFRTNNCVAWNWRTRDWNWRALFIGSKFLLLSRNLHWSSHRKKKKKKNYRNWLLGSNNIVIIAWANEAPLFFVRGILFGCIISHGERLSLRGVVVLLDFFWPCSGE